MREAWTTCKGGSRGFPAQVRIVRGGSTETSLSKATLGSLFSGRGGPINTAAASSMLQLYGAAPGPPMPKALAKPAAAAANGLAEGQLKAKAEAAKAKAEAAKQQVVLARAKDRRR